MIRVGQVGVGQWGKNHLKILSEMDVDYRGFYDTESDKFKEHPGITQHKVLLRLIRTTDALVITAPTSTHYEIAKIALLYGVHVFIEKPVCNEVWQAEELAKLAQGLIIQVGHIERFNPAYQRLKKENFNPQFIMCHRYTKTPDRCNDVSVVLDLMIHDIDLVLDLMHGEIKSIDTASDNQIISATLKFDDKKEAILYSGTSKFDTRRMMVWHGNESCYYKLDFKRRILYKNGMPLQEKTNENLLELELKAFIKSVRENKPPLVGIDDAIKSLKVAKKIEDIINEKDLSKMSQG